MAKSVKHKKTERAELSENIDYKDVETIRSYLSVVGKIVGKYYTGLTRNQQKSLTLAIKRAREMALLPNTAKY